MSTDPRIAAVLFATDRRESLPQVTQWLEEGKVVILDRYTSASLLHQGAKIADETKRKEILQWIYRLEHEILGLPKPDLLVYLNVPASERLKLLQEQHAANGRELDQAERNGLHQEAVDRATADMLSTYAHSIEIQCVEGEQLRSREEIADLIETPVRAILSL